MPAAVETGVFNVERGVPWHKLGTPNECFMTAQEVLCKAGLDWEVELQPIYLPDGTILPEHNAVVRSTDNKALGVVGNRYHPTQNIEVLSFMDTLIGSGQALYDSAWSLRGGRTVAISAELPTIAPAEGEDIRTFLTAATSHDGQGKMRYIVSPIRVVCMNTLAMAVKDAKFTWERKHTQNALSPESVKEAREALNLALTYQEYINSEAKRLIGEAFSKRRFETLAKNLIFGDKEGIAKHEAGEATAQKENQFENLLSVYNNSENLANVRDTKWGAFNAVAEFADYFGRYRGENKEDNRVESIMMGRAVALKTKAHKLLAA